MSTVPTELDRIAKGTMGLQPAWKNEVSDKVAAARARRQLGQRGAGAAPAEAQKAEEAGAKAARVAAAVAARYAQAPSYSEYMATEVRQVLAAAAEAQAAAVAARVQAEALLLEPVAGEVPAAEVPVAAMAAAERVTPRVDHTASGFPYGDNAAARDGDSATARMERPRRPQAEPARHAAGPLADPMQEAMILPATPLPAKLLEFPRELVASRKARPRHAEGPLRADGSEEPSLRIFEVEAEAAAATVAAPQGTEWSSIRLDAYPVEQAGVLAAAQERRGQRENAVPAQAHVSAYRQREQDASLQVASLSDRLLAGLVDGTLVGIAFVLFVFVFASTTQHPPMGKPAMIGGAVVLAVFYLLYQLLFFTFSESTPGMLYARIALCTFDDDNPSRQAMRKRIFALVLAAMPLGLGFLYALFDEDHLGWHDRMTRMYQRSYR